LGDCRHVSGSLERFLIERGERVLRIPTHLAAPARWSAGQRGKSDPIARFYDRQLPPRVSTASAACSRWSEPSSRHSLDRFRPTEFLRRIPLAAQHAKRDRVDESLDRRA
jgi:hypothetical protein